MKKKIITTNSYVKNFKFYNDNNFLIIDRDNPIINKNFLESCYSAVAEDIIYEYSPEKFVVELFKDL